MVSGYNTNYKYNGKEFDGEAGVNLYYYGARYYDPQIGRFISVDPVKDYTNPYSYVRNNPLNAIDPTGKIGLVIPLVTHGGFFGGFGSDLQSFENLMAGAELRYGWAELAPMSCGSFKQNYGYYKWVNYQGHSYTVWLNPTEEGFVIDPNQPGVKDLATAMIRTGEYNPEGDITKCNIFTHDLCELLGASYPHYGGEESNKLVANDLYNSAVNSGNYVSKDQAYAGFLVVWYDKGHGHVGMYMGGDNFISRGKKVDNYGKISETTAIVGSDPIYIPVYYVPDYYYQGGYFYEYWGW